MKRSVENCIAMSEDGDWYAFPHDFSRADVIGALAGDHNGWRAVLREFHVKRGYVVQGLHGAEGWYFEAQAGDADAILCWIAKRR